MADCAVAVIAPNDNGVTGVVRFSMEAKTLHIDYTINGLTDGEHGFHIHQYGDLTDGCDSACAHFNPDGTEHGGLNSEVRHLGDLGNIESQDGVAKGRLSTDTLSLDGKKRNCIVGRMIIVHEDRDDLGLGGDAESLKTGNAGKRLGCGVIGLSEGFSEKNAESLTESAPYIGFGMLVGAVSGWLLSRRN
jgi:Cu-Zn family superoxide dismutase